MCAVIKSSFGKLLKRNRYVHIRNLQVLAAGLSNKVDLTSFSVIFFQNEVLSITCVTLLSSLFKTWKQKPFASLSFVSIWDIKSFLDTKDQEISRFLIPCFFEEYFSQGSILKFLYFILASLYLTGPKVETHIGENRKENDMSSWKSWGMLCC